MKEFANLASSVVVLKLDDELHEKLGKYAREHELVSAWVEGLGGAQSMTLGYYDIAKQEYTWKEFGDVHEILSLQGNLAWVDGEPVWHVHGAFSNKDFNSVGGHVKQLIVGATCELHITPLETPMTRVFDDETGLKLLTKV
jgi:predicted DNA-binding protein with PD1-like motif